jgi:hypothetical protein
VGPLAVAGLYEFWHDKTALGAGSLDRSDAVAVLRTLKKAGYALLPNDVYSWALSNGWPAGGAERLKETGGRPWKRAAAPQLKGRCSEELALRGLFSPGRYGVRS